MQSEPPLQRDAVVRIVWQHDVIAAIAVSGRPAHPYPGTEGSHATAWAVLCDSVRRNLHGKTFDGACRALMNLLGDVDPRYYANSRNGFYQPEADLLLDQTRKAGFLAAVERAWTAYWLADKGQGDPRQHLRNAVAAYLTARNLAPLASANMGPATALGRGEAKHLKVLRAFEAEPDGMLRDEVLDSIFGLLDPSVLSFVLAEGDPMTVPGVQPVPDGRSAAMSWMIVRHLYEVAQAYPLAYGASGLDDRDTVLSYLEYNLPTAVAAAGIPDTSILPPMPTVTDPAAPSWSVPAGSGTVAVVDLTTDNRKVLSIRFAGRGNTLLNKQGHHVTAHVAIQASVERSVLGQDLPTALRQLIGLAEQTAALPTFPAQHAIADPARNDPKNLFAPVLNAFVAALESARLTARPDALTSELVEAIESLAASYIALRNVLPLAAIEFGGLGNHRGEQRAMQLLRGWLGGETGVPSAGDACGTLWKLLDWAALANLVTDDRALQEWAPGAPDAWLDRLTQALAVFLYTAETAFSPVAQNAQLRSRPSVRWLLLDAAHIRLSDEEWHRLDASLGLTDGTVQPRVPFGDQKVVNDAYVPTTGDNGPVVVKGTVYDRSKGLGLRRVKPVNYAGM